MAAIGSVTFDYLKGPALLAPASGVTAEQRPGVDLDRYLLVGRRGTPVSWQGQRDHTSAANARTWISDLNGLRGTTVSVVDEHGHTITDVLVLGCEASQPKAIVDPQVGASLRYRVQARVELVVTE